jgi:hypothetical protein
MRLGGIAIVKMEDGARVRGYERLIAALGLEERVGELRAEGVAWMDGEVTVLQEKRER